MHAIVPPRISRGNIFRCLKEEQRCSSRPFQGVLFMSRENMPAGVFLGEDLIALRRGCAVVKAIELAAHRRRELTDAERWLLTDIVLCLGAVARSYLHAVFEFTRASNEAAIEVYLEGMGRTKESGLPRRDSPTCMSVSRREDQKYAGVCKNCSFRRQHKERDLRPVDIAIESSAVRITSASRER